MSNYIIDVRVSGGTDVSPGKGSSGGSNAGGLLSVGGKLGLIAGAATLMVSLLKEVLWVFKPLQNLLSGILKTLGLFLQPIADLLFMLVQPLLSFIRPLAMLFRAMMMPVMNLLRQYSAVMGQQMASGDNIGAAKTGVDMIGLALGGFFISLAQVVGQVLIGVLGNLLSTLTTGLIDVATLLITPVLSVIDSIFRTNLVDKLLVSAETLKTNVSLGFEQGINYAQEALVIGTSTMMDTLVGHYQTKLDKLKETTNITLIDGAVVPLENTIANTSASIATQTNNLSNLTSTALSTMTTATDNALNTSYTSSIPSQFSGALSIMKNSIDTFVEDAVTAGNKITSALRSAQNAESRARQINFNLLKIG